MTDDAATFDLGVPEIAVLLALDDATGKPVIDGTTFAQATAAAGLAELVLLDRLRLDEESGEFVADGSAAPDHLATFTEDAEGRAPQAALSRLVAFGGSRAPASRLREDVLARLHDGDVLAHETTRFLGATWAERWPRGRARALEDAVQARARALLGGGGAADQDDRVAAALIILHAAKALPAVFPDLDREVVRAHADSLAEGAWAGAAVRAALAEMQTVMLVALTTTTMITMGSGDGS